MTETAPVGGIDLAYADSAAAPGSQPGPTLLCLHETGATGACWEPLERALADRLRVIRPDRRGWGKSGQPQPYTRTTISEQSGDAAELLQHLGIESAAPCGAGLGAVAALDLAVREPHLISAVICIEPNLLALAERATEGLSGDVERISKAVQEEGPAAAVDLYLSGELEFLGPGSARLAQRQPPEQPQPARERPVSLFAEMAAVPDWPLPLAELAATSVPVTVLTGSDTPGLLVEVADALAPLIGGADRERFDQDPLAGPQLAELATALFE